MRFIIIIAIALTACQKHESQETEQVDRLEPEAERQPGLVANLHARRGQVWKGLAEVDAFASSEETLAEPRRAIDSYADIIW